MRENSNSLRITHLIEDIGEIFVHSFCTCYSSLLYPVYLNFYVTKLSEQQRDLQLYVESKAHRGLKFYHQKYNPLTPWWNERGLNPRLSGRERAPNPLSHENLVKNFMVSYWKLLLLDKFSNFLLVRWCTNCHLGVNITNSRRKRDGVLHFLSIISSDHPVILMEAELQRHVQSCWTPQG